MNNKISHCRGFFSCIAPYGIKNQPSRHVLTPSGNRQSPPFNGQDQSFHHENMIARSFSIIPSRKRKNNYHSRTTQFASATTMMIRTLPSRSLSVYPAPLAPSTTICCSSRNDAYIPKLQPFSRSKLERVMKDPPLIQKSENDLADYCSTLEGDPSYSCWRAYFELKDLEKEEPKEVVERVILESGGVKSLVGYLHGISEIHKAKKQLNHEKGSNMDNSNSEITKAAGAERTCPIPDGLPKSREEMEEEEKGKMPDSPFTRLLRSKGTSPAWYSHAPDHETD
ncbi:hypothetical protein LXL04_038354 [Taraxacum kok-saghyz]